MGQLLLRELSTRGSVARAHEPSNESLACPDCGGVFPLSAMDISGVCRACATQPDRAHHAKTSASSRFLRGGVLGMIDERACMPDEQLRLTAGPGVLGTVRRLFFLLVLALAGFAGLVFVLVMIAQSMSAGPSSTSFSSTPIDMASPKPVLPYVRVIDDDGSDDRTLTFRDWNLRRSTLRGTMTWNGKRRIADINYTVRRGGVVMRRGTVDIIGGVFMKDEPTSVELYLGDADAAGLDVTIEVQY